MKLGLLSDAGFWIGSEWSATKSGIRRNPGYNHDAPQPAASCFCHPDIVEDRTVRIVSFRVLNYKSYQDSGDIPLGEGMNIVVGANSVGKSVMLEALSMGFKGRPHRSIQSIPHPEDAENPTSEVIVRASGMGSEIRRTFLRNGASVWIPLPADAPREESTGRRVAEQIFGHSITAYLKFFADAGSGCTVHRDRKAVIWSGGPQPNEVGPNDMLVYPTYDRRGIGSIGFGSGSGDTLTSLAAQTLTSRTFRFQAERLNVGKCPTGTSRILAADASNLPEVLSNLGANPELFNEYEELVRQVLPRVEAVTVQPSSNNQVEIRVWQLPSATRRDDLAFPLAECGTGIGQVLAILYIVVSSLDPQIVLIDEPNSFLHPGAARALIRVFRRFPQHQYVIATHAPEIIAEAGNCPVLRVGWSNGASNCTVFPERTTAVSRQLLADVGARLSDVFGFDHVLWTEGPSDQACISAIIETAVGELPGLAVLPVRDTGNFERRRAADIVAIYRQASMGSALLPPTVGFLLDREGRTKDELQKVREETKGAVSFLRRRMLENYLIEPTTVSEVLSDELGGGSQSVSSGLIEDWLKARGSDPEYAAARHSPMSESWLHEVHGARVLKDMFADLSDARIEFRKTIHCERLVRALLQRNRSHLDPLIAEIKERVRPLQD